MKNVITFVLIISVVNLIIGCGSSVINLDDPPIGESVVIKLIDGTQKEGVILKKVGTVIKYVDAQSHKPEDLDVKKIKGVVYADKVYDLEGNVITDEKISEEKSSKKTIVYGLGGFVLGAAAGFGVGALMAESVALIYPMAALGIVGAVYFGIKGSQNARDDAIDDIRSSRYESSQAKLREKLESEKKRLLEQKDKQDKLKKDLQKDDN